MNKNIPAIKCYVRKEFLHDRLEEWDKFVSCWMFAVRSVKGQALQFYALLETGAMFTGLPLSAFSKTNYNVCNTLAVGEAQLWDNLSNNIDIIEFSFLQGMRCCVLLKNKKKVWGEYKFTIDYLHQDPNMLNTSLSHDPSEWKGLHVVELNDGNFVAYPPNRIFFKDAALTLPNADPSKEGYRINTTTYSCEDGNKFSVGNAEEYMYKEKLDKTP